MNRRPTCLALAVLLAVLAVVGAGAAQTPPTRPIDRWLVATAPAPDSLNADARLATDLLAAPGEQGVLPDRGGSTGGVTWQLLRRDDEARFSMDSLLPEAAPGDVVYAHAYLRLPVDRTLRLQWGAAGCTQAKAWLNGRELEGSSVAARFGAGWNTLLLKLVAGDCPLGLRASVADGDIRVQASRPPGDVRTGPDDWVVPADTARIANVPEWRGDRLYAGLVIALTSWGRAAVADVELELQNGPDGKTTAPWLIPGTPGEAVVPVRFDELDRLLAAGRVDVRLRWNDEEIERAVYVAGTPPGVDSGIRLAGWEVKRTAGQAERPREAGRLPNGAGWILQGEWKVPKALAGRALAIRAAEAPATYTVNGRPGRVESGGVTLCAPCEEGTKLRLTATSTDAWTSMPTAGARPASPGNDDS